MKPHNIRTTSVALIAILILASSSTVRATGQSQIKSPADTSQLKSPSQRAVEPSSDDGGDTYFRAIYREFYNDYKLGPEDQIALRVQSQPDYSLEQVTISPVGRIYHPLLGELDVAGITVPELVAKMTRELSQYIIEPKVSISLISANSAKIGVLGDVTHPGIVLMARPMTVLDAIAASGGVTDLGSKSDVTVLRQMPGGRSTIKKINVKRILDAKADPEENLMLQAGDTIIVHGNTRKKIATITSMLGFASFLGFLRGF